MQHAFALLQKLKQSRHETVKLYAETVTTLSEDAHDRTNNTVAEAVVQQQLVGCFIYGLNSNHLKVKLM